MSTYTWIHLLSMGIYAIATLALAAFFIPRARGETDPARRMARAADAMKIYDPFSIGALGVMIMTGAFSLTAYKDALRERFFEQMGMVLVWKLFFTFILTIVAAYLAFGLGNRLVGSLELEEDPDPQWVNSMLTRIQVVSIIVLALWGGIVWIATAL